MKVAIGILLAIVLVLAWQLNAEIMTSRAQQEQIQQLTLSLADKSKRDNLEVQEKCAAQAEKIFRTFAYDGGYVSHYNAKLNRCFMTAGPNTSLSEIRITESLYDAYEGREYATVQESFKEGKGRILELCDIRIEGKIVLCKSRQEYDSFVARYME